MISLRVQERKPSDILIIYRIIYHSWKHKFPFSGIQFTYLNRNDFDNDYIYVVVHNNNLIALLMINRIAAEGTLKVPFRGHPRFSASKRLLSFEADAHIKVKALSREAKDIEVPFNNPPTFTCLSQANSWLYELTPARLLQVHQIDYLNGIAEGSSKKIAILHNVEEFREIKGGLALVAVNRTLKSITFKDLAQQTEVNLNIDANALPSVTQLQGNYQLHTNPYSQRIIVTRCSKQQLQTASNPLTEIFDRTTSSLSYQKTTSLTYLTCLLALYQDRFAFQRRLEKEVEIYDIEESKLVGRFAVQGALKFVELSVNLLLIVTSKESTDYCHFFVLNQDPSNGQSIITHRAIYQKGKGDFYQVINMLTAEAGVILDKKKGSDFPEGRIARVDDNTSSVLYVLNKAKQKVEIIKQDHSKVLKCAFSEDRLDQVVYSKEKQSSQSLANGPSPSIATEKAEYQRARVKVSIEARAGQRSVQQLQKQLVESLIDIKLRGVLQRFQKLERRVESLQRLIIGISEKVESNVAKINREEIRLNVEKLFDSLTPQFERYFKEIFQQVAGVLQQGVGYYNMKLAKEAELHKEALAQIVTETFKATEDIVQIGRREQGISERTEDHLRKILDSKKRWTKQTEDCEARLRQVPTPSLRQPQGKSAQGESKSEAKVFVRADLNYPPGRREG